jgi:hypothetical protein
MRRSDGGELFEWFLVSGIVSVLLIRWVLSLTGYPQLGAGGLHIAHMLWGGLLMLVALVLFFLVLDRRAHRAAAVVAGLGFGTFVDEIGKFVTSDNDYFFRPAIAVIYLIFVGLFLFLRAFESAHDLTPEEALANAMDVAAPGTSGSLDREEREVAAALLDQADPTDPLVAAMRDWLAGLPERSIEQSRLERLWEGAARFYQAAIASPRFEGVLVAVMLLDVGGAVVGTIALLSLIGGGTASEASTVSGIARTVSSLVGALLVLRGIPELRRSRAAAYHWFRRGVLVWILVTQAFIFYISQFAGVAGLGVQLLTYTVLTYMLDRELATGAAPHAAARASASTGH